MSNRFSHVVLIIHKSLAAAALICCLCSVTPAAAQIVCEETNSTISFGNVNVLSGSTTYSSTSATLICYNYSSSATVNVTLCLSAGSGSGGGSASSRLLSSGSSTLPVELRQTATVPAPPAQIGDGTSGPMSGPFYLTAAPSSFGFGSMPITADIPAQATLPLPGTYTSTFSGTQFNLYATTAAVGGNCSQVVSQAMSTYTGGTLEVDATIPDQCTVAASAMNFGTAALLTTALTATATITLTCNAASSVTVSLDNGATGTGPTSRAMTSGTNTVQYAIYQDSARSVPWGSTTGVNTQAANVTGSGSLTLTAYGSVPVQLSAAPGNYSDVVNVTISY